MNKRKRKKWKEKTEKREKIEKYVKCKKESKGKEINDFKRISWEKLWKKGEKRGHK